MSHIHWKEFLAASREKKKITESLRPVTEIERVHAVCANTRINNATYKTRDIINDHCGFLFSSFCGNYSALLLFFQPLNFCPLK